MAADCVVHHLITSALHRTWWPRCLDPSLRGPDPSLRGPSSCRCFDSGRSITPWCVGFRSAIVAIVASFRAPTAVLPPPTEGPPRCMLPLLPGILDRFALSYGSALEIEDPVWKWKVESGRWRGAVQQPSMIRPAMF